MLAQRFYGHPCSAIHRANGGFLIFNALDALSDAAVWPALKRILRYRQTEIQAHDQLSLVPKYDVEARAHAVRCEGDHDRG